MRPYPANLAATVACILMIMLLHTEALPLTVEKLSLDRITKESSVIVYGTVVSSRSMWEGRAINTYTQIRIRETLKGDSETIVTVKQMGGTVGEISDEVSGSPTLTIGEDVVLFLVHWKGDYWIHSIVLGKFSVRTENGNRVAYNDLNNIGLIDPVTKQEVTEPRERQNHFPLHEFLAQIRAYDKQ